VSQRSVLVLGHTGRDDARKAMRQAADRFAAEGLQVRMLETEVSDVGPDHATTVVGAERAAEGCELVVVFGGDGTLLRAAELSRPAGVPLVGVNLGHVGFLADAESDGLAAAVDRLVARDYSVEERLTIEVSVQAGGEVVHRSWALNEACVQRHGDEHMLDVVVEIDGRPLSRWGCDGVVLATPTGSTAYAFSGGGPVVWPEVDALLLVPVSAHALFARPMVTAPDSVLAVEVAAGSVGSGILWCDGRRAFQLPRGARVEGTRGARPVRFARLHPAPFTDRLVAKFDLPVQGWRGRGAERLRRNDGSSRDAGGGRA
jgi:NAD+ kinase